MDQKNNSGDRNSGDLNSGNRNSGNRNSGDRNSGDRNSGDRNSGNRNSGNRNSGNRNSGNRNSGYLNSGNNFVRMFNKDTGLEFGELPFPDYFYFDFVPVYLERIGGENMTNEEKEENQSRETTGGYLKKTDNANGDGKKYMKECWRKARDSATHEDKMKTFDLPNFDADIFEEITGLHIHDYGKEKYFFKKNDGEMMEFDSKKKMIEYVESL